MRTSVSGPRGLTFVELLMAITLFSLLMVGLAAHLRGAVTAWRRATKTAEALQRLRVALDQWRGDLANAVLVDARPDAPLPIEWAHDRVRFSTVRADRVWWVAYEWDAGTSALVRSRQTLREAQAALPRQPTPALSHVTRLWLRYGYLLDAAAERIEWREAWDDPTQLPQLIEVTLELRSPFLPPRVRRTMIIPAGTLVPRGAAP